MSRTYFTTNPGPKKRCNQKLKSIKSMCIVYITLNIQIRGRGRIRTGVKRFCRPWTKPLIPHAHQLSEPLIRFELTTCALRMRCSTD